MQVKERIPVLRHVGPREMQTKFLYSLSIVSVAVLPAATILVLIHLLFGTTIFHDYPSTQLVWNDEIYYWHQIATFKWAGFNGGYYTYQEVSAPNFSHFATHGPMFPMLYGALGYLVGWHFYSIPLFHLVLITLAIIFYTRIARLRGMQILATGLLLITFWPLMLFAATGLEEGLHYAIALVLAVIFYWVITKKGDLPLAARIGIVVFLIAISFLRITWSVLLIPYFVYTGRRSVRAVILSLVKAGVTILLLVLGFSRISAPYSYDWYSYLVRVPGINIKLQALKDHTLSNAKLWLYQQGNVQLVALERYQVSVLLLILCVLALISAAAFMVRRRSGGQLNTKFTSMVSGIAEVPLLFYLVNCGLIVVLTIALYDLFGFRDYRAIAPHLLLAMLLVIALRRRFWLAITAMFIISNVVVAPTFVHNYHDWRGDSFSYSPQDMAAIAAFHKTLGSYIYYQEGKDPWCNTLLSSFPGGLPPPLPPIMLGVPAGIGISVDYTGNASPLPLKSRYILTTEENVRELMKTTHLQFLSSTPYYNLYLNLDKHC